MAKKASKKNKESNKKPYVWKNKSFDPNGPTQAVLMWPNIATPYTYLNTLAEAPADHTYERHIAGYARGILNMNLANNSYDSQKYNQEKAIGYLRKVADAQRGNEIAFIEEKIAEMQNFDGKTSEELKEQLVQFINNPESFKYSTFITIINKAISGVNTFLSRVSRIKGDVQGRDLERNIMSGVETLFYSYTERRRRYNLSVEELTRTLVMKFIQTDERMQNFFSQLVTSRVAGGQQRGAAVIVLLQRLFATYINEHHAEYLKAKNDYFSREEFIKAFNTLTSKINEDIDKNQVDRILSDQTLQNEIVKEYGITIGKQGKVGNSGRKKADEGTVTGEKANEELKKMLDKLGLNDKKYATQNQQLHDYFKKVNFNYTPDKKISFQEELMTAINTMLNGHAHLGKLNMGTDYIGVYIPTFDEDSKKEADNIAKQFTTSLQTRLKKEKAQNNPEKIKQIYTEELNKLKKILNGFKKGFVLHESTKLYTSIEGKGGSFYNSQGFSGRSMSLMNYIDEMSNFSQDMGLDADWLKFLAYNISNEALGSGNKSNLEEVLATAAAIIMFDDVNEIAESITVPETSATSVHLYKLNGIYIPISYYLYAVAGMTTQIFEIDPQEAATASITPATIVYSRPIPGVHAPTSAKDWNKVKGQAEKTKINVHFGAEFLTLVSNLLNSN